MKLLKFVRPEYLKADFRWGEDVDRIVKICHERGYFISEADAKHTWEQHSDDYAASWLMLDQDDDEVFLNVMQQCEVIDDGNV